MSFLRGVLVSMASGYLKVVCRAICGLITFRLLYSTLGAEDFGFWFVLWATFGFMVLVDFGLGGAVNKAVAHAAGRPTPETQQVAQAAVTSVFWLGIAMTALIGTGLFLGGDRLVGHLLDRNGIIDPAHRAHLTMVAGLFALGMLVCYPFGIFREALRAQQRAHIANGCDVIAMLTQAGLIAWGSASGWGIMEFMVTSVATSLVPVVVVTLVALRQPLLRPDPRRFALRDVAGLGSFSAFIYLNGICNQILSRVDAVLISSLVSLSAVAGFAPGQRLAETFGLLTQQQLQVVLAPASAHLDARAPDAQARRAVLTRLLLTSQRWSVMIGASLLAPLVLDMGGALRVLGGSSAIGSDSQTVAWLLLATVASSVLGSSCSREVLLMTGHHRLALSCNVGEAVVKLTLTVALLLSLDSIVGAAIGSLVPAAVINLVIIPALLQRLFGVRWQQMVGETARGLAGAGAAWMVASAWWAFRPIADPMWNFLTGCALVAAAMTPGWWFLGMIDDERARVRGWGLRLVERLRR